MKTKNEIILELKKSHPSLRLGSEEEGYIELEAADYEAKINEWADSEMAKEEAKAQAEAKATQKAALLDRLGITEDEAKLLLA